MSGNSVADRTRTTSYTSNDCGALHRHNSIPAVTSLAAVGGRQPDFKFNHLSATTAVSDNLLTITNRTLSPVQSCEAQHEAEK